MILGSSLGSPFKPTLLDLPQHALAVPNNFISTSIPLVDLSSLFVDIAIVHETRYNRTMAHYLQLLGTAIVLYLGSFLFKSISEHRRVSKATLQHGCKPPKRYPNWDPILGMDLFAMIRKADSRGQCSKFYAKLHGKYGATFEMKALSRTQVQIAQPENIQAVAATQFSDFGVGPMRGNIGAPFLDRGIFTEDGEFWKHSRSLVRPTFNRTEIADLPSFERHVARFLHLIPKDGSTFDLQALAKRLVSTENAKLHRHDHNTHEY